MVQDGLTEVTCDERPDDSEQNHVTVLGMNAPRRGGSKWKVLRLRPASGLQGTAKDQCDGGKERGDTVPVKSLIL